MQVKRRGGQIQYFCKWCHMAGGHIIGINGNGWQLFNLRWFRFWWCLRLYLKINEWSGWSFFLYWDTSSFLTLSLKNITIRVGDSTAPKTTGIAYFVRGSLRKEFFFWWGLIWPSTKYLEYIWLAIVLYPSFPNIKALQWLRYDHCTVE